MSDPMTEAKCREFQHLCSGAVHAEIGALREVVQQMDQERGANRVRFEQMVKDITEIKANVVVIRKEADTLYAIKLIERIVFGIVGLICIAVITALVKLVVAK